MILGQLRMGARQAKNAPLSKGPSSNTGINLVFDRTISVTRSTFSINEQTFLTRLGGSVSSGRTLLWILVTLLGAPQVKKEASKSLLT